MTETSATPYTTTRPPILRTPLRTEVRRLLLTGLLHGDPAPGSGINEAELAARLGVSRTPLREALLDLEREGLIAIAPGRGFSVQPLTTRDADEIYPIIASLEVLALGQISKRTPKRLQELDALNARLEAARKDAEQALALDREWHATLLADCSNRRLLSLLESLKNQAYRYEFAFMRYSGKVVHSVGQHRGIVRALRRGDHAAAGALLNANWIASLDFLRPWLAGREPST
jgi:DNA-binding GntR family transcriptional regulator